jgi:N-methylhydantoinase A
MILSGTASGVIGVGHLARQCGFPRVLSLDIGGTSADMAVIVDGEAKYGVGELIGDFQIHIPSVAVSSVGQGGGSVASVDAHGVLHVGPASAGSTPGPACYGRGGTLPTVTDAVVACNLVGHMPLGYGAVRVDAAAARRAIEPLAAALGDSVEAVAGLIIEISVSSMYAEASALISRFGVDPREFHLFPFGGAGAMLACFLARELDMKGVVVPPTPGVVSALGGLIADLKNDFIRTVYCDLNAASLATLAAPLAELERAATSWLRDGQRFAGAANLQVSADMRYAGQSYEIETALEGRWIAAGDLAAVAAAFHAEHARMFGHADPSAAIQVINLRVVISGQTPKPKLRPLEEAIGPAAPRLVVDAWLDRAWRRTAVYHREDLRAGHRFEGPAIVAQDDTTTVVPPDFSVAVDRFGNLVMRRTEA